MQRAETEITPASCPFLMKCDIRTSRIEKNRLCHTHVTRICDGMGISCNMSMTDEIFENHFEKIEMENSMKWRIWCISSSFYISFSLLPTPLEPPLFQFSPFSLSSFIPFVYQRLTMKPPHFCLHKYISDTYRTTQYHTRPFCITKFSSNFFYLLELFVPLSGTFCSS